MHVHMYISIYLSIYLSVYLSIYLPIYLSIYIFIYIYICIHAYFWWYTLKWGATWPLFLGFPHLKRFFPGRKFVGSTGLGRRKIAQTFSLSPWHLVVGPFRYFWLVAWISARKPGSESSIYGFTINRWGCNGYTWIFAINEGKNTYVYIYNIIIYIYIHTCFNLFIWVTVKMCEDHFSTAGVFCRKCAPNTVKR